MHFSLVFPNKKGIFSHLGGPRNHGTQSPSFLVIFIRPPLGGLCQMTKWLARACWLGVIQQLCRPNFTQFWPPPPSSGQVWTLYMIPTLCHMTKRGFSTEPLPPLMNDPQVLASLLFSFTSQIIFCLFSFFDIYQIRLSLNSHFSSAQSLMATL